MSMVSALLLVWQETSGVFGNEATNQGIKLRKGSSGGPLPGLVLSIEVELICKTFGGSNLSQSYLRECAVCTGNSPATSDFST